MQRNPSHSSRSEYLSNLEDFLETARDNLRNFTETLGWTEIKDVTDMHSNSEKTRSPEKSNEFNEEPLLPAIPVKGVSAITIDADVQRNVLAAYRRPDAPDQRQPPLAAGELIANFSRQERVALYEYTLQNAAGVAPPPELSMMENVFKKEEQPKELSGLELAKAMRDFKRRRQAYRTKVSTKNKSHTEVAREIIHNMMVYIGATELETDAPHQTSELRDEIGKEGEHPSDQKDCVTHSRKESASSSRDDSSPFRRSYDRGDERDKHDRRREQESDSRYNRRVDRGDSNESRKRNRGEGREEEIAYRRADNRERCDYEVREYRKNSSRWGSSFDEARDDKQLDRRREREGDYKREKEGVYRGRSREERSWEESGREKVKERDKRYISEFEKDYYKDRKERERQKYHSEYYCPEGKERKYETEREHYSNKMEGRYGERNEREFKKRIKVEKHTEDGELSSSESEKRGSSYERESTLTDHKKKRKMKKKKSKRKHKKKKSKSNHRHCSKSDSEDLSSEEEHQRYYKKVDGYVKEEKI